MHEELPFRIIFAEMYVAGFLMRGLFVRRLQQRGERIVPPKGAVGGNSRFRVVF
ncbi:hypothetical protein [Prosthecochloris sp. ZM]|uniref:hypothetical protein n=1 Tax=Prosthecochloris sp. ZM TaxID=2283143 RepID=UPI001FC96B28|nr:hypothetical protein [Prosthecochloris sp. ZM]